MELLSNLSSSTEIEQDTKERNLRRSKRLTKTNPIVRLNNPAPLDYRKYSQKTKRPGNNPGRRGHYRQQRDPFNVPEEIYNNWSTNKDTARNTAAKQYSLGRTTTSKENRSPPLASSGPITEGGMKHRMVAPMF